MGLVLGVKAPARLEPRDPDVAGPQGSQAALQAFCQPSLSSESSWRFCQGPWDPPPRGHSHRQAPRQGLHRRRGWATALQEAPQLEQTEPERHSPANVHHRCAPPEAASFQMLPAPCARGQVLPQPGEVVRSKAHRSQGCVHRAARTIPGPQEAPSARCRPAKRAVPSCPAPLTWSSGHTCIPGGFG